MTTILEKAINITISNGGGSVSLLQKKLMLCQIKAEKLMAQMEKLGVIGKKTFYDIPRRLLIKSIEEVKVNP